MNLCRSAQKASFSGSGFGHGRVGRPVADRPTSPHAAGCQSKHTAACHQRRVVDFRSRSAGAPLEARWRPALIILYHSTFTRSYLIRFALEELGLPGSGERARDRDLDLPQALVACSGTTRDLDARPLWSGRWRQCLSLLAPDPDRNRVWRPGRRAPGIRAPLRACSARSWRKPTKSKPGHRS